MMTIISPLDWNHLICFIHRLTLWVNLKFIIMKKLMYLIGLLVAIVGFWSCENDNDEPVLVSKLEVKEISSEALLNNPIDNPEVRKMQVYLPKGYDASSTKKYPVVYLLHGLPFTEESFTSPDSWDSWIGGTSPFQIYPDFPQESFKDWLDQLIESGAVQPMIIVMPNAANMYGFSFYTNSILNGGFEDYIVQDVVNFIDSNYRTIANKDGRAVIGFSQGGYAAVKFGMMHPDKFSVIASHSGLLYLDGILSMGEIVIAENPGGFTGPDPDKFLTTGLYAMSSAWSPNLNNPPWFVDLPIDWDSGAIILSVREKWMEHDVFTLLDKQAESLQSLNGVFIDCGTMDELGFTAIVDAFCQKMEAMAIDHTYESFEGGHFTHMYSRLEKSLTFVSEKID